jgi:hypothetical protein
MSRNDKEKIRRKWRERGHRISDKRPEKNNNNASSF